MGGSFLGQARLPPAPAAEVMATPLLPTGGRWPACDSWAEGASPTKDGAASSFPKQLGVVALLCLPCGCCVSHWRLQMPRRVPASPLSVRPPARPLGIRFLPGSGLVTLCLSRRARGTQHFAGTAALVAGGGRLAAFAVGAPFSPAPPPDGVKKQKPN